MSGGRPCLMSVFSLRSVCVVQTFTLMVHLSPILICLPCAFLASRKFFWCVWRLVSLLDSWLGWSRFDAHAVRFAQSSQIFAPGAVVFVTSFNVASNITPPAVVCLLPCDVVNSCVWSYGRYCIRYSTVSGVVFGTACDVVLPLVSCVVLCLTWYCIGSSVWYCVLYGTVAGWMYGTASEMVMYLKW